MQLRRTKEEFDSRGARIVAVSPAEGASAFAVCGMFDVTYACLGDPTGAAYDAFGLERGESSHLYNVRTLVRGFLAFLRGHRQGRRLGDPFRLPGAFIIDREGIVRWSWRGRDAADHPDAIRLLSALEAVKPA